MRADTANHLASAARSALGGYVPLDHPGHPSKWSPDRQDALAIADADLTQATEALRAAVYAHTNRANWCRPASTNSWPWSPRNRTGDQMPDQTPEFPRYAASVVARRDCQTTRDDLGGYVDIDHADHPSNSSPKRRAAIRHADAALQRAVLEMESARSAHMGTLT
jgi:hypothetical protein